MSQKNKNRDFEEDDDLEDNLDYKKKKDKEKKFRDLRKNKKDSEYFS